MNGKSNITKSPMELIGTRVRPEVKERFQMAAQAEERSASAELRRMIERRVKEFESELARAA